LGELTSQGRAERDAIIADIHSAFAGVGRGERAISWSECYALDMYEPEDVCEAARRSDTDTHWSELIASVDWQPFPGVGGFSFINAEGFRYYLPPTMIRFLGGDNSEWYPGHLLGVIERFTAPRLLPLWSESQLRSIARFVSFMARHDNEVCLRPDEPNPWSEAIDRRWHAYLYS
jgi:hypothetical protein